MSHVRRLRIARLTSVVAALGGVLLAGCASQPYSQIAADHSAAASPATSAASAGASSSASGGASALVPPDPAGSGDAALKAAKGFTLPSVVGNYKLSTDPQLEGIYQLNSSPTDIYTAQVTSVSVDAGEIATSLFHGGVQQISGNFCGQITGQPAVCIRQLNGGYLQVTGSGSKAIRDVAAFATSLYRAA